MNKLMSLPNFFILGVAKSGTTTLYEVLNKHPEIYLPLVKEPQFFSNDVLYSKGLDYYSNTFFSNSSKYKAVGEATPHYLYYEKVAKRINDCISSDNLKFIVILRDPVKRAYSLYWNMVQEGVENLSFVDAIDAENDRLNDNSLASSGSLKFSYLDSGLYVKQIEYFIRYFNKEQILILFHDDLINNPEELYKTIFDFLDVSKIDVNQLSKQYFNESAMPKYRWIHDYLRGNSKLKRTLGRILPYNLKYQFVTKIIKLNMKNTQYPEIDPAVEKRLREYFLQDINKLEYLTGRNLGAWK